MTIWRGGPVPAQIPQELVAEVVRLAQDEGLSQSQIGKKLGIFKSKVHSILMTAGVKTRFWQHGCKKVEPGEEKWNQEKSMKPVSLAPTPSMDRSNDY